MNIARITLIPLALAGALAAGHASAATTTRIELQNAAGMCQPFSPTGQVRYDSSGLRNAGTAQFYVVCSLSANWQGSQNGGGTDLAINVYNSSAVATSVACTARPGYYSGASSAQIASPKSTTLDPGSSMTFGWSATDFGTTYINTPNITCTVKPGISIQWTNFVYEEEIGT
jgi:hypothetical protein